MKCLLLTTCIIGTTSFAAISSSSHSTNVEKRDMSEWLPLSGRVENELALLSPQLFRAVPEVEDGLLYGITSSTSSSTQTSFGADGYTISVSPLTIDDGGYVTVTYNVLTPKKNDWLALYLNGTAGGPLSPTSTPLKFTFIDDTNYLLTGNGTRQVQIINMRALNGFSFALLSGGLNSSALVTAISIPAIVVSGDNNAPTRPRVTPASSDGSAFRISWTSGRNTTVALPLLRWSTTSSDMQSSILNGTNLMTTSLLQSELCGSPANSTGWHDLGFTHSGILNLSSLLIRPTRVWYQIGDTLSLFNAPSISLAIPSLAGTYKYPSKIIAFDDLGRGSFDDAQSWREYGKPSQNTSRALTSLLENSTATPAFDLIWHVGDISYSTGYLSVADWFSFMINSWASRVCYVIGFGNHESGQPWDTTESGPSEFNHFSLFDTNDSGGECGLVTNHIVPLPTTSSSTGNDGDATTIKTPWSLFSSGPFALVTLSTEHNFSAFSQQWIWLNKTLSSINRTLTPFILLGAHRPMYIDSDYVIDSTAQRGRGPSTADIPVMTALQKHVEPLTMKYKVTAAFYGHNHAVQRLTPAYLNQSVQNSIPFIRSDGTAARIFERPRATMHLVIGTGGAGFTQNCASAVGLQAPSFSERCFFQWGFLTVTAQSPTLIEFDWQDSSTGEIEERISLIQDIEQVWADQIGSKNDASNTAIKYILISVGVVIGTCGFLTATFFIWKFKWRRTIVKNNPNNDRQGLLSVIL